MANLFVFPYTCILANVPGKMVEGQYVPRNLHKLANTLNNQGYRIEGLCMPNSTQDAHFNGVVHIEFGEDETTCKLAFKLAEKFEEAGRGRDDYYAACKPIQGPYLWIATKRDAEHFRCTPLCKKVLYALKKAGRDLAEADNICIVGYINIAL